MDKSALFGIYCRGLAMGAADVVPGVSGGTVALITGIYSRLLSALARVDQKMLSLLLDKDVAGAWRYIDGRFLLTLLAGIATSVFMFAGVISHLLESQPLLLWSFFTGLIAASGIYLLSQVERWNFAMVMLLLAGVAIAMWISAARPVEPSDALWYFFACGAIAICAMVLPGISGSFILVLMGAYAPVMLAVKQLDFSILAVFVVGCALGLLSFVRLLNWLLLSRQREVMSLLTGFLLGSLTLVWPWKHTVSWYTSRSGELRPLQQSNVLPGGEYQALTGSDSQLMWCIVVMIFGAVLVGGLDYFGRRGNSTASES